MIASGSSERGLSAGDDDQVAALGRGLTHSRALGAVPGRHPQPKIVITLEVGLTSFRARAVRFLMASSGMCVVDNHVEGLTRTYLLKAAWNRMQQGDRSDELVEGNSAGMSCGERTEQVEHVHFASQARSNLCRADWGG